MAVSRSIEINASPVRIWQEFADPERWAGWMGKFNKVEPLTGSPVQAGGQARMHWTERASSRDRDYGPRVQEREATWDVPAVEAGKMIRMGQRPNFTTWRLEPISGGTRVSMDAELNSFAAKLFGPITRMFAGAQGSIDLKRLKKKCESD